MHSERWKITERLLAHASSTTGRMVMAIAPAAIDVILYEAPVLASASPSRNPLRGFIQEAISLLDRPTAADIGKLLLLPTATVELVLGNLRLMGGAVSDAAGRWWVPEGAPRFGIDGECPGVWRRTRKLLCYWPKRQILLPVLPRLRLRDLVALEVHKLQGEAAEGYNEIASWPDAEASRRGRGEFTRILPLSQMVSATEAGSHSPASPDAPVTEKDILVNRCTLEVIALSSVALRSGVWEMTSRLWSRPQPATPDEATPFAPGEPMPGLSLPESLLSNSAWLGDLGDLFSDDSNAWRGLLLDQSDHHNVYRDLQGDGPALLFGASTSETDRGRWKGLQTRIAPEARLLCFCPPSLVESGVR